MPFTQTFYGFVDTTLDALLIVEACRRGLLRTVNRRLIERERQSIKSGTIIVFDETESGIKRWTDGFLWSPSRILGNFLVYRELENREHRQISDDYSLTSNVCQTPSASVTPHSLSMKQQQDRALVGSLTSTNTSYNFKKDGLIKKTIRMLVNGNFLHIVAYYNKDDVLNHRLPVPSTSPELACLQIPTDLMPHLQGTNNNSAPSSQSTKTDSNRGGHRKRTRKQSFEESDHKEYRARSDSYDSRLNYFHPSSSSSSSTLSNSSSGSIPSLMSYTNTNSSLLYNGRNSIRPIFFNENNPYCNSTASLPPPFGVDEVRNCGSNGGGGSSSSTSYSPASNLYRLNLSSDNHLLSPSPSPTPSPPTTLPVPSSCGDTAILANRFNQFYSPVVPALMTDRAVSGGSGSHPFDARKTAPFADF